MPLEVLLGHYMIQGGRGGHESFISVSVPRFALVILVWGRSPGGKSIGTRINADVPAAILRLPTRSPPVFCGPLSHWFDPRDSPFLFNWLDESR